MNNTLIDTWFTVDQLVTIRSSLKEYYYYCSTSDQLELKPIIEHLEHLIEHYKD